MLSTDAEGETIAPEPGIYNFVVSQDTTPLQGASGTDDASEAFRVVEPTDKAIYGGRKRRSKPFWQTLLETATGGLAGLLVGYYLLAFYYGADFKNMGWPILPLPGIASLTAPAEKQAEDATPIESENASQEPADDAPKASSPDNAAEKPAPDEKKSSDASQPTSPATAIRQLRPALGSAEYVGPRVARTATSDELGEALKTAVAAGTAAQTDEASLTPAYEAFCRLAETLVFLNGDPADSLLIERLEGAKKLIAAVGQRSELFEKVAQAANARIADANDQHRGILLVGAVKEVAQQGPIRDTLVELVGQGSSVSVLTNQALDVKVDDKVVAIGVVVRKPAANLVGYGGGKPTVVWAALVVKAP